MKMTFMEFDILKDQLLLTKYTFIELYFFKDSVPFLQKSLLKLSLHSKHHQQEFLENIDISMMMMTITTSMKFDILKSLWLSPKYTFLELSFLQITVPDAPLILAKCCFIKCCFITLVEPKVVKCLRLSSESMFISFSGSA